MNLEKHLPQSWHHRRRIWWVVAAAAVAIIVAIVVPLAVLLPRKHSTFLPTTVLLPLYIYPMNASSWTPVYDAAEANPKLNFLVVVNPNSGPGNESLPSDDYTSAINKLNSYENVQTVGYVRTGYATRNMTDVVREIGIYAGWHNAAGNLTMHGIFFDESPHEYTPEAVAYLQTVDAIARNTSGIEGPQTIIHNPGVIPDSEFLSQTKPNITVIFEESFEVWQQRGAAVEAMSANRSGNCIMMNSVPDYANTTLEAFVSNLTVAAEYLFLSDRSTNFYEFFADNWDEFVAAVPVR